MVELWCDKEANQILKKHGNDPEKTYVFETGFGPSGKPHFGTFGEVVRTNYVMLAMQDQGYKTKLIAFSDDLDGLRKIPEGFPVWLQDYIGHPVSAIPDPLGDEYESFSGRMNALLVKMLEELQLDFEFRSSAETYRAGLFNDQITKVIQNYEAVQEIIFPYLREETQENWFPFFPICENCGSVGHTRVTDVDKENLTVQYACDREFGGKPGCGHQGEVSVLNGAGKLQWKVDWPARWDAFGVHYEMFGKDLIESAEVGDRIVQRVFHGKPPVHMFYELFLAEDGTKISKSKGTGLTAEEWLQYGTHDSLMMLMLDKPREAKELSRRVIPRYMDMVLKSAEAYYSSTEDKNEGQQRDARQYQFINLFKPSDESPVLIDFMTLTNLVGNVGLSDPEIVEDYLHRSDLIPATLSDDQRTALHELILKAKRYYDDVMAVNLQAPELDVQDGFLLGLLVDYLEAGEYDADTLHNELFQIPRRHDVQANKFFRAVYSALIKQERGPRGGQFIKLLGQATAADLIRQRIAESVADTKTEADHDQPAMLPVAISHVVKDRYPELAVGVAVIEGVKISSKRPDDLDKRIQNAVQARASVELDVAMGDGAIAAYRKLYETFGANPNAMTPSSEAMLHLAVNDGRLPSVNNLVDGVNLVVLETGISAALYDLDQLEAPLLLRFSEDGDHHHALGTRHVDELKAGELVYADQQAVICRALNHRDSDKTKITNRTQNILLIMDGSPGISVIEVYQALEAALQNIHDFAGGEVQTKAILL